MIVSEIETKMKEALRAKDLELKSDYSYLLSRFRAKEVELRHSLSDAEALDVIKKEVKSLTKDYDSLSGNQLETKYAMSLKRQIELFSAYLPKKMSYTEIMAYLAGMAADCELPITFGPAMKVVRAKIGNQTDGKMLAAAVKDFLEHGV